MKDLLLPDLDTKSVLDVVEENFKKLGLKAYAVRIIYIGEHTFTKNDILEHFEKSVQDVNSSYCEINVHGFFLVYDSYFVHILEGSEDTVHRQLRFLLKREENWIKEMESKEEESSLKVIMDEEPKKEYKMFRRLKMLMVYHSIQTRIFDCWRSATARPPSLVGKLNVHGPLDEHMEQLRICLGKIGRLCSLAKADENLHFDGLPVTDPKIEVLPEVALLDFLLQSPHIMDLRNVVHLHRRVDDYYFYFDTNQLLTILSYYPLAIENVWPLPAHFTPRHLYKLKIDDSFVEPLPVMPWELAHKEEKEGEEQEERQSPSSDSD